MLREMKHSNPKVKCLVASPSVVAALKKGEKVYTLDMTVNYKLLDIHIMGCNHLHGSDVFTFESSDEGMKFRQWMQLKVVDQGHPARKVIMQFKRRAKTGVKI